MQKIGSITSTADTHGEFGEGSPAGGIAATLIKAGWLNTIQRELAALVEGAGLALDPSDDSQALKAVRAMVVSALTWSEITGKPTTLGGYGITDAYTKGEAATVIEQAVADLVSSAPEALDTLSELAAALGGDANFATTVLNALAGKASTAEPSFTGVLSLLGSSLSIRCSDPPNVENLHLWVRNYDGTERGLMFVDNTGVWHWRSNGGEVSMTLDSSKNLGVGGSLGVAGTASISGRASVGELLAGGAVYAGNGSAYLNTDGNILGSAWFGGNIVVDLGNTIPSRVALQTSTGMVGSYALLRNRTGITINPGMVSGGALNYAATSGAEQGAVAGTWMAMGGCANGETTLFLRKF